jgi:hypothetical protein
MWGLLPTTFTQNIIKTWTFTIRPLGSLTTKQIDRDISIFPLFRELLQFLFPFFSVLYHFIGYRLNHTITWFLEQVYETILIGFATAK